MAITASVRKTVKEAARIENGTDNPIRTSARSSKHKTIDETTRASAKEASSLKTSALKTVIMMEVFDLQVEFDQYSYNFREKTSNSVIKDFNCDIAIHRKKNDNGKEAGVNS
ncbi:hypothetical protein PG984_013303 [Apiospora sp. TS-2023a]